MQTRDCISYPCPVDGEWGPWSSFTCSATCGGGTQMRTRQCSNPPPRFGGADCPGFAKEGSMMTCNEDLCPIGVWGVWGRWTPVTCSATCGGGTRTRSRFCTGGLKCLGGQATEELRCNTEECPGAEFLYFYLFQPLVKVRRLTIEFSANILDPEAIQIKQNQLLQTLESWGPTFTISMEIKITSFQKQEEGHWGEILRLTSRPGDCCLNGQRVPVVFLSRTNCSKSLSNQINVVLEPYSRSFYITTSIGGNADKKFHIDGLEENIWYKMVLSQKKTGV